MPQPNENNQRVSIIGAGVVGVATAYYLAKAGYRVTVIERLKAPAEFSSRANAGIIAVGHATSWAGPGAPLQMVRAILGKEPSMKISKFVDLKLWRWGLEFLRHCSADANQRNTNAVRALAQYGRQALKEIEVDLKIDFEQSHEGAYYLHTSQNGHSEDTSETHHTNADVAAVDAETLIELEPTLASFGTKLAGGLISRIDSKGDCNSFTKTVAKESQENLGVEFHFDQEVTGYEFSGRRVSGVKTPSKTYECDQLIICAGTATPTLCQAFGVKPLIYPVKGYSATYPIIDAKRLPSKPFVDEAHMIAFTQLGSVLRVTGLIEFAGYDRSIPPERAKLLDIYVERYFDKSIDVSKGEYWAGFRPSTPTGRPYLGRIKKPENVWLNAGHGYLGWTMAAGAGATIANGISGKPSKYVQFSQPASWLEPLTP